MLFITYGINSFELQIDLGFYGLIRANPVKPIRVIQTFLIENLHRESLHCLVRDRLKTKNSTNFNKDAFDHLTNYPIRSGIIDNISAWLFYGGNWSSIYRAIESGVPLAPSRFGPCAVLVDTACAANEYVPCTRCNAGDVITDSICLCDKTEGENFIFFLSY